jgi:hypothetical protein
MIASAGTFGACCVAALAGWGMAGAVRATVINDPNTVIVYQDLFNRGTSTSPAALDGSTPSTDNYTGAPTWTTHLTSGSSAAYANTNGSDLIVNCDLGGSSGYGYLPFSPQAGHIYDLSVTYEYTQGSSRSDWFATGFITSSSSYAWMLQRGEQTTNDTGVQAFMGSGSGNPLGNIGNSPARNTLTTYDVVLNTTGAAWTATFYQNGNQLATHAYTTNPTITGVGWHDTTYVDVAANNFTLTDTPVPAPASLALFAVGGLGLLITSRKRRRLA